ncbi:hypothetical protein CHU98_g7012 [Xylaria longipes]|nr:hypothetical protein CHU98_g7012 [Xylaria longipes]
MKATSVPTTAVKTRGTSRLRPVIRSSLRTPVSSPRIGKITSGTAAPRGGVAVTRMVHNTRARNYVDIAHPSPVVVHLSQVPDRLDVRDCGGSGEWVKIYTLGYEFVDDDPDRIIFLAHNYTGLPGRSQTPAGEYLLRIDLIWAYPKTDQPIPEGYTQLYPSCA